MAFLFQKNREKKSVFNPLKTQESVFSKWCSKILSIYRIPFNSIYDLKDGVNLIHLVQIISEKSIGCDWYSCPIDEFKMRRNIESVFDYIKNEMGIFLFPTSPEDIYNVNIKATLSLIWELFNYFSISKISFGLET